MFSTKAVCDDAKKSGAILMRAAYLLGRVMCPDLFLNADLLTTHHCHVFELPFVFITHL